MGPTEWESYSENNIAKARNTRSMSENLRRKIQELLGSAFQQLNNQNAQVQLAFGKRITETTNAKRQLEGQYRRVCLLLFFFCYLNKCHRISPRTCNLWNVLPSSCFPESYNLPSFKSKTNKFDLVSLSS